MANILLITYMFPPAGGIGTPRALAYTQYLPRTACRVSVLAPSKPALRDYDPDLSRLIPPDVVVHRARTPEPSMSVRDQVWRDQGVLSTSTARPGAARWLVQSLRGLAHHMLFPDPQVLWALSAYRKACWVIKHDQIDTVIVNTPPYSLLKLALWLKRRFPHLKLITDFRDEWLAYYLTRIDEPNDGKRRRAKELEARAVHASTYVSTVTETWVERLRRRYPKEPQSKFICTPNGYDPNLFQGFQPAPRKNGKIIVTYFGTVHKNRVYSTDNYFAALESLPHDIRNQIETRFIGRIVGDSQAFSKRTSANVQVLGFMPKQQGIRHLQEADFLLLIASDPSSHAGKLFDYLACRKPILALSPPGSEIDRLLQLSRTGWCAHPSDRSAIRDMILSACGQLRQGLPLINPNLDAIHAYSWPNVFSRFAAAVDLEPAAEIERATELQESVLTTYA